MATIIDREPPPYLGLLFWSGLGAGGVERYYVDGTEPDDALDALTNVINARVQLSPVQFKVYAARVSKLNTIGDMYWADMALDPVYGQYENVDANPTVLPPDNAVLIHSESTQGGHNQRWLHIMTSDLIDATTGDFNPPVIWKTAFAAYQTALINNTYFVGKDLVLDGTLIEETTKVVLNRMGNHRVGVPSLRAKAKFS